MDEILAKRLLILALVTFSALGTFAMLLYAGLVHYRAIFEKLLFMIVPPLLALSGWSENRSKRTRYGLQNSKLTPARVAFVVIMVGSYALVTFLWFDRFESFFIFVPVLIAFVYAMYLGGRTRRERASRVKN